MNSDPDLLIFKCVRLVPFTHSREQTEEMLKFLSKVRIEFNALDPRTAVCMEFLAHCNARKAKESNPACQLVVKRRTDDHPPQISVTFVNGVEEVFDAASTSAQNIRTMILEKGQHLETEQMFRDAGEPWPVIIPEEELHQRTPGAKVCFNFLFLLCFFLIVDRFVYLLILLIAMLFGGAFHLSVDWYIFCWFVLFSWLYFVDLFGVLVDCWVID